MKLCSLFFVILLMSSLLCSMDARLEEVLKKNTAAMGGREAVEKVQSVEIHLTIQEPEFTVDAVYVADRKIRMRIDVYAGNARVFTEAFDGKKGWQMGEDGKAKDATPDGSAALRNGIFLPGKFFGLYELPAQGHHLAYEGIERVDSIAYHVLKLTLDNGKEIFLYLHTETGLVERTRDVKALHPDVDPTKMLTETVHSDFRKIDGSMRSFQSTQKDLTTGKIMQTTTVKEVKINPKLDDSLFVKP